MATAVITALLFIAHGANAGVVRTPQRAYGTCQQLTIPVTVSANSAVYDLRPVDNDIDAVAYGITSDTWSEKVGPATVLQNTTTEGTFNIHAQLCTPSSSDKADILQIASHGLHYDGRYWDPELNRSANSYVEAAMRAGYSILTYDRLGVGQSDKPDAYSVVQAPIQLEILHQLTLKARNGTLCSSSTSPKRSQTSNNPNTACLPPSKIIHIGHSFGSVLTSAYISTYGTFSDGAIITGYVPNKYLGTIGACAFSLEYAATSNTGPHADPTLPTFTDRTSGYAVATKQGIQNIFFAGDPATAFTPELLSYGNAIKQPLTVGEYTSAYTLVLAAINGSTEFSGPLQYILPEFDFYICRGDCKGVQDEEALSALFPNAADWEFNIQPNTGHALTLHNNATAGYELTFGFLERNGL